MAGFSLSDFSFLPYPIQKSPITIKQTGPKNIVFNFSGPADITQSSPNGGISLALSTQGNNQFTAGQGVDQKVAQLSGKGNDSFSVKPGSKNSLFFFSGGQGQDSANLPKGNYQTLGDGVLFDESTGNTIVLDRIDKITYA